MDTKTKTLWLIKGVLALALAVMIALIVRDVRRLSEYGKSGLVEWEAMDEVDEGTGSDIDGMAGLLGGNGGMHDQVSGPLAELPVPEGAKVMWFGEDGTGGWQQQTGVWMVDGKDVAEVWRWCADRLKEAGYHGSGRGGDTGTDSARGDVMLKGERMLVVRAMEGGGKVRLVMQLRYTTQQAEQE